MCKVHFLNDEILKEKVFERLDGNEMVYKFSKPSLKLGAIPTIFPNVSKYLSKLGIKRKPLTIRTVSLKKKKKITYNWGSYNN